MPKPTTHYMMRTATARSTVKTTSTPCPAGDPEVSLLILRFVATMAKTDTLHREARYRSRFVSVLVLAQRPLEYCRGKNSISRLLGMCKKISSESRGWVTLESSSLSASVLAQGAQYIRCALVA